MFSTRRGLQECSIFILDLPARVTPVDGESEESAKFSATMQALGKLGLKLAPAKAVGQFLVIDHVERPSGN